MRFRVALIVACVLTAPLLAARQDRAVTSVSYDVVEKSIVELQEAMTRGEVTSRQLVDAYLARIAAYDQQGPALNAIAATNPEARAQADALDAERKAKGPRGPLHGIPLLVKDNYETVEMPTTAGSIALATFHPKRDAYLVQRLEAAGAVILGKTTMHELAAGILTVGSSFGRAKNPYDLDRTPGGSSGGTGAAIAANFAAAGMGSDTCGSIRIPAANNNLVGLRGTQGLSSRTGIVPLSSSQDIGGPLARGIEDLAIVLDATVGVDSRDAQTVAAAAAADAAEIDIGGYRRSLDAGALKGARLGVVRTLFGDAPEDQEVTRIVDQALEQLEKAGVELVEVTIPGLDELLQNSSMINADFKFDLMEYLAGAEAPPVRSLQEILDRGLYHSALESTIRARNAVESREGESARRARYRQAMLRAVLEGTLNAERLDAIVYPTLRRRPSRIGDGQSGSTCSVSAHSGLPALAVPAGFTTDGVPIGMELLGTAFSEQQLLNFGLGIERTLRLRKAPFSTPPLVDGKAPAVRTTTVNAPGAAITLRFAETTAQLEYRVALDPKRSGQMQAVWLHHGTTDAPGAARHTLYDARGNASASASGTLTLTSADREQLRKGRMLLRLYPGTGEPVTIHLPEVRAWQ